MCVISSGHWSLLNKSVALSVFCCAFSEGILACLAKGFVHGKDKPLGDMPVNVLRFQPLNLFH
jgi:hypothetical protein